MMKWGDDGYDDDEKENIMKQIFWCGLCREVWFIKKKKFNMNTFM